MHSWSRWATVVGMLVVVGCASASVPGWRTAPGTGGMCSVAVFGTSVAPMDVFGEASPRCVIVAHHDPSGTSEDAFHWVPASYREAAMASGYMLACQKHITQPVAAEVRRTYGWVFADDFEGGGYWALASFVPEGDEVAEDTACGFLGATIQRRP